MWTERLSKLVARRPPLQGWAIAAAVLLTTIGLLTAFPAWTRHLPLLTLFCAVVITALVCGWQQGAAVLVVAATVAWLFLLPAIGTVRVITVRPIVPVISFVIFGSFTVAVVAALGELVRRLEAAKKIHESLFQELQHRVANNMQFIAAMLQQARREMDSGPAADVLDQASARIASMARLSRQLSDPNAYQRGLQPVLHDLLAEVFQGFPVDLVLDIRTRSLSLDQMTVIVLLVSEAATNAVKHVFQPRQGRLFEVTLTTSAGGRLCLTIRDDGPGLSPAPMPAQAAQKLGMRIMQALAAQLGGSLQFKEERGVTLQVEFAAA